MSCKHPATEITTSFVTDVNSPLMAGFITCYIDVFAGPPYFEHYEPEWVEEHVWKPHIPHCVVIAQDGDFVIGLGCCHPVTADTEPSIKRFLLEQDLPFDPELTIFLSELAVRSEYRRQGLGMRLIHERLAWAERNKFTHYAMRTAETGSNSLRMHLRMGSEKLPFVQDVSCGEVESESKNRIYLYGKVDIYRSR